MQELQANGVEIYQFPVDDESVSEVNSAMNSHIPFAVVGSTDFVKIGNKTVRARQYPWGTVQGNCILFISSLLSIYLTLFLCVFLKFCTWKWHGRINGNRLILIDFPHSFIVY